MPPPDPRNRAAFNSHLDYNLPSSMSREELFIEGAHWSQWLDDNGYIGNEPSPGRLLKWLSYGIEAMGVFFTYLGAAGHISDTAGLLSTWGGIAVMTLGLLLMKFSSAAVQRDRDAVVSVGLRLRTINQELSSIRYGHRR
ncbi:hypothetical protein J3R80_12755 [Aliiroseovarius sp. Z3]|uniref:hypothetical protein n=1 Tax=Aliiroseovarius sp. Z3 TaxID=2811402 RepID=UPI0023B346DC|nr:hypothetical protein [Aliiroseovarius sp. Z3]MDE9451338.1 hypothetical protein [Aliiroseovarius sp. Z3]